MRQCDLNKVIIGSTTERAEVLGAIAGFAEDVGRLALHFKLTAAIACAAEAERAAEALRAAVGSATEAVELQSRLDAVSSDEVQAGLVLEIPATEMSPRPNGWLGDARNSEMEPGDDLYAVRTALAKVSAAFVNPTDVSPRTEKGHCGVDLT